jgi:hypothetical protein
MAFVCTLDDFSPNADLQPNQRSIFLPVGYDDADETLYQLYIGFDTAPGGITEYSFCLICIALDGTTTDCWDAREVAAIIGSQDRARLLEALLGCTSALLQVHQPESVTMRTFIRDLPRPALVKYDRITQIFIENRYKVTAKERRGHHTWTFVRAVEQPPSTATTRRP